MRLYGKWLLPPPFGAAYVSHPELNPNRQSQTCGASWAKTLQVPNGSAPGGHDILISQTVAMTSGLFAEAEGDPEVLPQGSVAALESPEEDEALFERISPIQGLRDALAPAPTQPTEDDWVNEELAGPLREVFGPLPKEPADVPPLEFTSSQQAPPHYPPGPIASIAFTVPGTHRLA